MPRDFFSIEHIRAIHLSVTSFFLFLFLFSSFSFYNLCFSTLFFHPLFKSWEEKKIDHTFLFKLHKNPQVCDAYGKNCFSIKKMFSRASKSDRNWIHKNDFSSRINNNIFFSYFTHSDRSGDVVMRRVNSQLKKRYNMKWRTR